jgi:hypothetical protein
MIKKLTTCLVMCALSFTLFAQTYFSSFEYNYCVYDSYTEKYDDCINYEKQNLFTISDDESSISISNSEGKALYFVLDRAVDMDKKQWWYEAMFSNGTKYILVFDILNNEIRIADVETASGVLYYFVSNSWIEE